MTAWRPENPTPEDRMARVRGAKPRTRRPGHVAANKAKWVQVNGLELAAFIGYGAGDEPDPDHEEVGEKPIILVIRRPGKRSDLNIALTSYTEAELRAMRDLLTELLDRSIPIAAKLDTQAKEKFQRGDSDTSTRLYRPLPTVVDRERSE